MIAAHSERSEVREEERPSFKHSEYMALYTTVYQMCIQKPPYCFTNELYERFDESIRSYLRETVLPAIERQHGEFALKELVLRWDNHAIMQKWLVNIFVYLNRFHTKRHNKRPLQEVSVLNFKAIVFDVRGRSRRACAASRSSPPRAQAVEPQATAAILELVERDREGVAVDRDLVRVSAARRPPPAARRPHPAARADAPPPSSARCASTSRSAWARSSRTSDSRPPSSRRPTSFTRARRAAGCRVTRARSTWSRPSR
jgi:hypothetical protein